MKKWIRWLDIERAMVCADGGALHREPPRLLEAREVWRQFRDNQVAAELYFGEASFCVTGHIDHVDRDERGRIRVHFRVNPYETLRVIFPEEALRQLTEILRGDEVTCRVRVAEVDSGVVLLEAVEL